MKQLLFFVFAFSLVLISCQKHESDSGKTMANPEATDRSSPYCCDSAGITMINGVGYTQVSVLSLDCCNTNTCDFEACSFPGNNTLSAIAQASSDYAMTYCLNNGFRSCQSKTVVDVGSPNTSQWVCLGNALQLPCFDYLTGLGPNNMPIQNTSEGVSLAKAAFELCRSANSVRAFAGQKALALDVECSSGDLVMEYAVLSRNTSCDGYPVTYPPYCFEIWVRYWCCNE